MNGLKKGGQAMKKVGRGERFWRILFAAIGRKGPALIEKR